MQIVALVAKFFFSLLLNLNAFSCLLLLLPLLSLFSPIISNIKKCVADGQLKKFKMSDLNFVADGGCN